MPELPEVEIIVRELRASHLLGLKIREVVVFWPRSIAEPSIEEFCQQIRNQTIKDITRRGKYIVFSLSQQTLLVHLRMTGKFSISMQQEIKSSHERVQLRLADGRTLHYEDQRKFGKWYLLFDPRTKLHNLGIEPLSEAFTLKAFQQLLKTSSQQIKPFLLDQKHLVGLGNIYVDEALWASKIHPEQKTNEVKQAQIKTLHVAIIDVLKQGIEYQGTTLGSTRANYYSVSGQRGGHQTQLKVFRRDGLHCPRCQTEIIRIKVAQRSSHICPKCQKKTYS